MTVCPFTSLFSVIFCRIILRFFGKSPGDGFGLQCGKHQQIVRRNYDSFRFSPLCCVYQGTRPFYTLYQPFHRSRVRIHHSHDLLGIHYISETNVYQSGQLLSSFLVHALPLFDILYLFPDLFDLGLQFNGNIGYRKVIGF